MSCLCHRLIVLELLLAWNDMMHIIMFWITLCTHSTGAFTCGFSMVVPLVFDKRLKIFLKFRAIILNCLEYLDNYTLFISWKFFNFELAWCGRINERHACDLQLLVNSSISQLTLFCIYFVWSNHIYMNSVPRLQFSHNLR